MRTIGTLLALLAALGCSGGDDEQDVPPETGGTGAGATGGAGATAGATGGSAAGGGASAAGGGGGQTGGGGQPMLASSGDCTGVAEPCGVITDGSLCARQKGCVWGFSGTCEGFAERCNGYTEAAACEAQTGCLWAPQ